MPNEWRGAAYCRQPLYLPRSLGWLVPLLIFFVNWDLPQLIRRRQVVDIQHAIQVVYLMLEGLRQQVL